MGIQYIQIDHGANKITSNRIFDLSQQLLDGVNLELIRTIMNLYLYGELERPEYFGDHIRTNETQDNITVNFNPDAFLNSSIGDVVRLSDFPLVDEYFSGVIEQRIIDRIAEIRSANQDVPSELLLFEAGEQINLTARQLAEYGVDVNLLHSFQHRGVGDTTEDFIFRTFIFNTQSFVLSEDIEFSFNQGEQSVANAVIRPTNRFGDDFDFESNEGVVNADLLDSLRRSILRQDLGDAPDPSEITSARIQRNRLTFLNIVPWQQLVEV